MMLYMKFDHIFPTDIKDLYVFEIEQKRMTKRRMDEEHWTIAILVAPVKRQVRR